MNLVQQAQKIKIRKHGSFISEDEILLALAYLSGEVSFSQIAKLKKVGHASTYGFVAVRLREAFKRGKIKIT